MEQQQPVLFLAQHMQETARDTSPFIPQFVISMTDVSVPKLTLGGCMTRPTHTHARLTEDHVYLNQSISFKWFRMSACTLVSVYNTLVYVYVCNT